MIPIRLSPAEVVEAPEWAPEPVEGGGEAEVAEVAGDATHEAAEVVLRVASLLGVILAEVVACQDLVQEELAVLFDRFAYHFLA